MEVFSLNELKTMYRSVHKEMCRLPVQDTGYRTLVKLLGMIKTQMTAVEAELR